MDNSSSNGSYYYPFGRLPLTNHLKEQLIISKEEGFSLKVRGVFKESRECSIKTSVEQVLNEHWKLANTEVLNRKGEVEER
jgi:hypothetical protein